MLEEDEEIPYYQEKKPVAGDALINKVKRIMSSALMFVLAFIASNMLLQALTAWLSLALKYSIRFSYNQVRVYPWDYHYWNRTNIVVIFMFSPLICFLLGLFILNVLRVYSSWSNMLRLFFFWFCVCLVNLVLTHALLAPLGTPMDRNNGLYQTFAVVGIFLWISPVLVNIAAIGALILSILFGVILRNEVMRYSFSKELITNKKGMDLVAFQVYVIPVLAGAIPVIALCSPVGFFTTLMEIANLGVIAIGVFIMNSIGIAGVRCNKNDVLNHLPVIELAVCGLAWLVIFIFFK